jgi:hypothetical protein
MDTTVYQDRLIAAERFKALHENSSLFVMPCAWDAFSAILSSVLDTPVWAQLVLDVDGPISFGMGATPEPLTVGMLEDIGILDGT